ncbi:hypothetical protein R5R35_009639 [Gryllus longicercus]|uniref:Tafazzin family protein n=1 Tax=Gryllus longicercus TaxID=2509291 RepID=A0AAN9Z1P2_9ORTH|nr:Tafazzin homolog [Gryllus bimaculatus]
MGYDVDWIIPKLRKPSVLWNLASSITCAAVGIFSKILLEWLNTTQVYNKDIVTTNIDKRPKNVPLLTVSNHHSCFDDPGLWGVLDIRQHLNRQKTRWSLAAHDICFTNVFHSYFFMLGKCVPVIRGKGVYQKALDFCLERLSKGEWVHIFPEGRVNMTKEFIRFKWGVGRLVYESPILPIIIPMWHIGMDKVLPNEPPYVLKMRNKVTLNYGKPIDLSELVNSLKMKNVSAQEARKTITDKIQDELMILKAETEKLHLLTLRS